MEIPFVDFTRRFRIIETDKTTYDSWICREGSCIEIEPLVKESITVAKLPDSNESLPIVRIQSNHITTYNCHKILTTVTKSPLESICGQFILSAFISKIAADISIEGGVRARGGKLAVDFSSGMRNGALDKLVNKTEKTGLAEIEDIFLSVIPALKKADKLPSSTLGNTKVFDASAKEISVCLQAGHFHEAEPLLLWLLHAVETSV